MNILITGGAGFIGQHLSRALMLNGARVRVLDCFSSQVHSVSQAASLDRTVAETIVADVRDRNAMKAALTGIDCVIHLAAETGTGQSMYEIDRYFSVNVQGTAMLIDLLQNDLSCGSLQSIIVASSRALYGEGSYLCDTHGIVYPEMRERERMSRGQFEPHCPLCDAEIVVHPTPETAPFMPMSIYGLTKQVQEQAVLLFARMRGINGFALRYQNVYGPGQSLKNPYTGILAVFSNLARQNMPVNVYEDGKESRDFVYIDDVVEATIRCVNYEGRFIGSLNVGSGQATSVLTVARAINRYFKSDGEISVTGAFRIGDIRHNIADISRIRDVLHFVPKVPFERGLSDFLGWAVGQSEENQSAYLRSVEELKSKGLMGFSGSQP